MAPLLPEVQAVLDENVALGRPDFANLTADEARTLFLELRVAPPELIPVAAVEDRTIAGPGGDLDVRIYRGTDEPNAPALLWFHGGGWVLGDLNSGDLPGRHLAARTGAVVVAVDYRLAPEHPFPAAFDDCFATVTWAVDNAPSLGIDPSRLGLGGDSAGGNLAACVAIAARDAGISLAHQMLVYPVVEAEFATPSYEQYAEGHFLTRAGMRWFWDHYTDPTDRADSRVAPMHADLTGLPPAWMYLASCDPLASEGRSYATALLDEGVPVELMEEPGAIHGVFSMTLDCGFRARDAAADAFRRAVSTDRS